MEKIIEFVISNIWGFILATILGVILKYFYKDVHDFRVIVEELENLLPPQKNVSEKSNLCNLPINAIKFGTVTTQTTFGDLDKILKKLETFDKKINKIFPLKKEILDSSQNLQHILNNRPEITKIEVSIYLDPLTYEIKTDMKSVIVKDEAKELEMTLETLKSIINTIHTNISYKTWLSDITFIRKLKIEYVFFIKPYVSILFKTCNYGFVDDDTSILVFGKRTDILPLKKIRYVNEIISIIFLVTLMLILIFV